MPAVSAAMDTKPFSTAAKSARVPDKTGARAHDLYPSLTGLAMPELGPDLTRVVQYLPQHLLPILNADVRSVAFTSLLLPTQYLVDELGRSEWFMYSRARLLADPVASVGYKVSRPHSGLRRPPGLTPAVISAGPGGTQAASSDLGDMSAHRRLVDTARVRIHNSRRAKRMRGVVLPQRNWDVVRGLEERVRLVECALTDEIPLLNTVPLARFPDYLAALDRKPICLLDLHKAVTLANSECQRGARVGILALRCFVSILSRVMRWQLPRAPCHCQPLIAAHSVLPALLAKSSSPFAPPLCLYRRRVELHLDALPQ